MIRLTLTRILNPAPLVILLFLIVGILSVAPARAADRDKLEAFLTVTGFDVALDSIALSAEHAPDMLGMSSSDFGSNWSSMAAQVFSSKVVHGMALDMLEATMTDELLDHGAGFYASDLGQRLVAVENASHLADDDMKGADGDALVEEYAQSNPERLDILKELNAAVDSGDNGVRAIQEIQVRFLMAASNAGVLDGEIDEAALRAIMEEGAAELRESIKESSLSSSAHTYQSLSDDDLADYVIALKNPTMQQVYELMNAIQHEVMADRFEALADRMAGAKQGQEL